MQVCTTDISQATLQCNLWMHGISTPSLQTPMYFPQGLTLPPAARRPPHLRLKLIEQSSSTRNVINHEVGRYFGISGIVECSRRTTSTGTFSRRSEVHFHSSMTLQVARSSLFEPCDHQHGHASGWALTRESQSTGCHFDMQNARLSRSGFALNANSSGSSS